MTTPITGSCLCHAIKYQITAEFEMALNCHCTICKKISGAAFESIALVSADAFEITRGNNFVRNYQVSEKGQKNFCSQCGTPLYNTHVQAPGKVLIHIGSLDDPTCVTPTLNLHAESKLPWVMEIGQLKTFEQGFEQG